LIDVGKFILFVFKNAMTEEVYRYIDVAKGRLFIIVRHIRRGYHF